MKRIRMISFLYGIMICIFAFAPAHYAFAQGGSPSGSVSATLQGIQGDIFVRLNGSPAWTVAKEGMTLSAGDTVRAAEDSAASIIFADKETVRLLPFSEISLDSTVSPSGEPSGVIVIDDGRVWANVDLKGKDDQLIIVTGNSIINSRRGSVFIETAQADGTSCMDVFQGSASVRPMSAPDRVMTLEANQHTLIGMDQGILPPTNIPGGRTDYNEQPYSCLNKDLGPAEETIKPEFEFASPPSANVETSTAVSTGSTGSADAPAAAEEQSADTAASEEEYEYETIEISGSTVMIFVKAPTGSCATPPVISDVAVSGQSVSAGGGIVLKSTSKCGPRAKPVITWTAAPKCGAISSMSISVAGATTRFPGGAAGESASGKHSFEITDSLSRNIIISALDSNGVETQLPFTVAVEEITTLKPPRITSLLINQEPVKSGAVLNVSSDLCEQYEFYVEGVAKSECGDIENVVVNVHEAPITVDGTGEFTATFYEKLSQTIPVTIYVKDVSGARSIPYSFSIDFNKTIPEPTVAIDVVGGYPVSSLGEPIDVYRNDLVGGRIVINGSAGSDRCSMKKVQLSFDGGGSWLNAEGSSAWAYRLAPREGDYEILARSFDEDERQSEDMFQPIEMTYYPKTKEEILQEFFETILRAYQDKDADTMLANISPSFSTPYNSIEDRGRIDNALNSKFIEISTVYLRYRVQNVIVSGLSGRVTFQWDATPYTTGYTKTGTFIFQKEGRNLWRLLTVEDDRTFLRYTNDVDSMEMTMSPTQLVANDTDTAVLTLKAYDSAGNAVRNGTPFRFTASSGSVSPATAYATDGAVSVTYTAGNIIGPATITATSGSVSETLDLTLTREFAPPPPGQ